MRVIKEPDLKKLATIRLPGKGTYLYLLEEERDLDFICQLQEKQEPFLVLGRGSNLIFAEKINQLLVRWLPKKRNLQVLREDKESITIGVDASFSLPRLLQVCVREGWSGLENLAGIPASLGGAVAMNAGSFGSEIGEVWEEVEIWTAETGKIKLSKDKVALGYRYFNCGYEFFLVVNLRLRLKKVSKSLVKEKITYWYKEKKDRQPLAYPSAGCVFKNPNKEVSAGKILEECGFRGKVLGGMAFSEKHANFLINLGQGNATDAFTLIDMAREEVFKQKDILLEPEVKLIKWQ